jgi:transglycosylase-like protein with SLT domain
MRGSLVVGAIVLLLCSCSVADRTAIASASPTAAASVTAVAATSTPTPDPTPTPRPDPPVAATDPALLAEQMVAAERAIRDPKVTGAELAWFGHLQQLTYRKLAAMPGLRDAVLKAVPADLVAAATANAGGTADLRATVVPGPNLPTTWRIVEPAPLLDLARYYRDAEAEFGVPWSYLAAIHLVETRMGRIRGTSTAGAQGPMQFIPATWARYGDGDINSNLDSIRAAARYLRANGAPGNMANALFRYNQSERYVRAVTAYAEVMRADPDAYRGYYQWQVYYLTTRGDILLPVGYGP